MRYKAIAATPEGLPPNSGLIGRQAVSETLERLLAAVRAGESRVLVVHGESGVGKTALLEYVADHAEDCRVTRAGGVESEKELANAGLHQLCAPVLDRVDQLPPPQRAALAFAVSAGAAPDRLVIGLAVLSIFSARSSRSFA
jgi:hypothetical protein